MPCSIFWRLRNGSGVSEHRRKHLANDHQGIVCGSMENVVQSRAETSTAKTL